LKTTIYLIGVSSVVADHVTSFIGLKYPEIAEMNPLANPILEGATIVGGQTLILKVGEKLKVNPKLTAKLALVPAVVPFGAALRNVVLIGIAHAKYYPWEECPLLFEEVKEE